MQTKQSVTKLDPLLPKQVLYQAELYPDSPKGKGYLAFQPAPGKRRERAKWYEMGTFGTSRRRKSRNSPGLRSPIVHGCRA